MEFLYRIFDKNNDLIYIGISNQWSERMHSHEKDSRWFEEASLIKIEKFETREDVERAERKAIRIEKPLYNKVFSNTYESKNDHLQKLKFWTHYQDVPVDENHVTLIEKMRESYDLLEVSGPRKGTKFIAYLFLHDYVWLNDAEDSECRNCRALFEDKQLASWAKMAEDNLATGGMK